MIGRVYRIAIQGGAVSKAHPHLVVAEFPQECWVVPAFDVEGFQAKMKYLEFENLGYPKDAIWVELDNTQHVQFRQGMTGKMANWFVARAYTLSKRLMTDGRLIGQMDQCGTSLVRAALLRLLKARPRDYPKKLRRALQPTAWPICANGAES